MNSILKLLDPYRWLIGGLIVASLIGGSLWWHADKVDDHEKAVIAKAVAEQKALADAQTKNLQEVADEAQSQYVKDMAAAKAAADRAAADLARLRGKAASADQLARASKTAIADYAADAERSVDFCAERLSRTGETAGSASAAAHALYAGWPAYTEFQGRLETFKTQLKGQ